MAKILIQFYNAKYSETYNNVDIYTSRVFPSAISLGLYVITKTNYTEDTKKHEYGHTRQSKFLGPLYLIIIGLPDVCWIGLRRISKWARSKSYYWFYTERWADILGGVLRKKC